MPILRDSCVFESIRHWASNYHMSNKYCISKSRALFSGRWLVRSTAAGLLATAVLSPLLHVALQQGRALAQTAEASEQEPAARANLSGFKRLDDMMQRVETQRRLLMETIKEIERQEQAERNAAARQANQQDHPRPRRAAGRAAVPDDQRQPVAAGKASHDAADKAAAAQREAEAKHVADALREVEAAKRARRAARAAEAKREVEAERQRKLAAAAARREAQAAERARQAELAAEAKREVEAERQRKLAAAAARREAQAAERARQAELAAEAKREAEAERQRKLAAARREAQAAERARQAELAAEAKRKADREWRRKLAAATAQREAEAARRARQAELAAEEKRRIRAERKAKAAHQRRRLAIAAAAVSREAQVAERDQRLKAQRARDERRRLRIAATEKLTSSSPGIVIRSGRSIVKRAPITQISKAATKLALENGFEIITSRVSGDIDSVWIQSTQSIDRDTIGYQRAKKSWFVVSWKSDDISHYLFGLPRTWRSWRHPHQVPRFRAASG